MGEANGKSSTFTVKLHRFIHTQIVWVPCVLTEVVTLLPCLARD